MYKESKESKNCQLQNYRLVLIIVITTVAGSVGRRGCRCWSRGYSGVHQGIQVGSLVDIPCCLGGRECLALIESCEGITYSIVDYARSFEFVGYFRCQRRRQRRAGEIGLQSIGSALGSLCVTIKDAIVQQTVGSWRGWQSQPSVTQQGRLQSGLTGLWQLQTHNAIVELIRIEILQEEAMEL